jgi:hypothetical protein
MKVLWEKTFKQSGVIEIPDGLDDKAQQDAAIEAADKAMPTLDENPETDIHWVWSDYFAEVTDNEGPEDREVDGVKYQEWFDI